MSEWKPIETAPKDGVQMVLLDSKAGHIAVGNWDDADWMNAWRKDGDAMVPPGWFPLKDATHWMPLPPPPVKGE